MEQQIVGTLIAEPSGRITKSTGELQANGAAVVTTAVKLLEGANCLIKGTPDQVLHKLNVTFEGYEYIITYDGNHIHVNLRRF